MSEKRPWTEEEDRLLKFVFETTKLTKWSHIARRLQEEFGVKGRNGKHCKERYTSHIDTSHPKDQWGSEEEQHLFELHNQLGNKWAVIGSKLGGKTDNCVKNHFYSLLRKSLRKINKVILEQLRRELKQIKPNVLYRIVEASEDRFKFTPTFEKEFVCFSNQLKNQLLEFSYDDEMEDEADQGSFNVQEAKKLIDKMGEFTMNYKMKAKKERRRSGQEQDLLTPDRYFKKKHCHSENDQSDLSPSIVNSSDMGNLDDISQDDINRSLNLKRSRRNSSDTAENTLDVPGRIKTRAISQDKLKSSSYDNIMKDEKDQIHQKTQKKLNEKQHEVEGILEGLEILQEDQNLPPHPMMMKKQTSKYSRISEDRQEYHFFEDSQIEMRILPEMTLVGKDSQVQENIFH